MNDKQEMFCIEYLVDLNATQAAIRAGYSPSTAGSQAHDLLKKPEIQERIQRLKLERAEKVKIDAEFVLREAKELLDVSKDQGDLRSAKGFLELIGKHTAVQAFRDVVQHEGQMTIVVGTGVPRAPDE